MGNIVYHVVSYYSDTNEHITQGVYDTIDEAYETVREFMADDIRTLRETFYYKVVKEDLLSIYKYKVWCYNSIDGSIIQMRVFNTQKEASQYVARKVDENLEINNTVYFYKITKEQSSRE